MSLKMKSFLGALVLLLCCFCSGTFSKSLEYKDAIKTLVRREAPPGNDTGPSGKCEKPIDLVFVLDSSESVGAENWMKIVNFTIKLAEKFDVKYTRVGVIQFHSSPEVPVVLTSFPDNTTLANTIGKIYYKAGSTRTDLAAMKLLEVFNTASHRRASKVAIFVLGGLSTDVFVTQGEPIEAIELLREPAKKLAEAHIAVYAADVKRDMKDPDVTKYKQEMDALVSMPPPEHVFDSESFDDLVTAKVDIIAKKTCIVNGGWGDWSEWSTCSVTCGGGTQLHIRACDDPKPENGGLKCDGPTVEQQHCNMQPCGDHNNVNGLTPAPTTSGNTETPSSGNITTTPAPSTSVNASQPNMTSSSSSSATTPLTSNTTTVTTNPLPTSTLNSTTNSSSSVLPPPTNPAPTTINSTAANSTTNNNTVIATTPSPTTPSTPVPPVTPAPAPEPSTTPAPTSSKPVTYGTLDYDQCGNNFELVQLRPGQLSASSVYTKDDPILSSLTIFKNHEPSNGVLNNIQKAGAWCADHKFAVQNDQSQYIQVKLDEPMLIGKIATQGMHRYANWVNTFSLRYSVDAYQWFTYPTTLKGNFDKDTVVENFLYPAINAMYLQFNPLTWNTAAGVGKNDICLRVGVYRCRACDLVPITRCLHSKAPNYISKKSRIEHPHNKQASTRNLHREHKKIERKHKSHSHAS